MRIDKVSYLCIVNLNSLIMVQGKKQLRVSQSSLRLQSVIMRQRRCVSLDVDKKAELRPSR